MRARCRSATCRRFSSGCNHLAIISLRRWLEKSAPSAQGFAHVVRMRGTSKSGVPCVTGERLTLPKEERTDGSTFG